MARQRPIPRKTGCERFRTLSVVGVVIGKSVVVVLPAIVFAGDDGHLDDEGFRTRVVGFQPINQQ